MISQRTLFFNGGEIQDLLLLRQKVLNNTSSYFLRWIDTTSTADIPISSKEALGVEVCTLGVKFTTSTFTITSLTTSSEGKFACGVK